MKRAAAVLLLVALLPVAALSAAGLAIFCVSRAILALAMDEL